MKNIMLPTPESLKARRVELETARARAMLEKIDKFCKDAMSPAIIKANEKMQTQLIFHLPTDIPFDEFDAYIQNLNRSLQEGTTQYVFTKIDQDSVVLDWSGQQ